MRSFARSHQDRRDDGSTTVSRCCCRVSLWESCSRSRRMVESIISIRLESFWISRRSVSLTLSRTLLMMTFSRMVSPAALTTTLRLVSLRSRMDWNCRMTDSRQAESCVTTLFSRNRESICSRRSLTTRLSVEVTVRAGVQLPMNRHTIRPMISEAM